MDDLTSILKELAEAYFAPEQVTFAGLGEDGGLALFPENGEAVESRKRSVTGRVRQICRYPFAVVYRAGGLPEERKAGIKERLEGFGAWLEQMEAFPAMQGGKLLSIGRVKAAHPDSQNKDMTGGWVIHLAARYEMIF